MRARLKIKTEKGAILPTKGTKLSAGYDLYCLKYEFKGKYIVYHTGVKMQIPKGYVGLLFPRSSVTNRDLMLKNSVGVIDSDYRGEVTFRFLTTKNGHCDIYKPGERIGQLLLMKNPEVKIIQTEELSDSERGSGGYGSTGR